MKELPRIPKLIRYRVPQNVRENPLLVNERFDSAIVRKAPHNFLEDSDNTLVSPRVDHLPVLAIDHSRHQ
jgi:hypothetical protein